MNKISMLIKLIDVMFIFKNTQQMLVLVNKVNFSPKKTLIIKFYNYCFITKIYHSRS